MIHRIAGLLLLLLLSEVQSLPAGPPLSPSNFNLICNQLMPNHAGASAQSGNGGYIITTNIPRSGSTGYGYTAGQIYSVTLSGSSTNRFRGFIVKAHVPGQDQMLLGQFIPQASQRTLDCDSVGAANAATVAHSNNARINFQSMTFTWRAPSGADGTVDFRYTVVRTFSVFYVRQSAAANDPTPIPPPPTTPPPTSSPPTTPPPITSSPTTTLPPTQIEMTTTQLPETTTIQPTTGSLVTTPDTATTQLQETTTQSLITTTQSPDTTTQSSVTTTQSPDITIQSSVTTTQSPDITTQSSVTTTQSPDITTQSSVTTTQSPDATTQLTETTTQTLGTTILSLATTTQSVEITTESDIDMTTRSLESDSTTVFPKIITHVGCFLLSTWLSLFL